jgi:hypothetical protein
VYDNKDPSDPDKSQGRIRCRGGVSILC